MVMVPTAPGVTELTGKVLLTEDGESGEGNEYFLVEAFLPDNFWPPDAIGTMTIIDGD